MNYTAIMEVIGAPYEVAADGPEAYDCWAIVRKFANVPRYWYDKDRSLVDIARMFAEEEKAGGWEELAKPEAGCVVALSTAKAYHHAGVWTGRAGVLHAAPPRVCVQPLSAMRAQGWRRFGFYKWLGDAAC